MFSSKEVVCIFAIFLISCSSPKSTVCEDSGTKCVKYKEVFESVGIQTDLNEINSNIILTVPEKDKYIASNIISYLNKFADEISTDKSNRLKSIFIPRQNILQDKKEIKKIADLSGVLSFDCSDEARVETDKSNCQLVYFSKILAEERLQEIVNQENSFHKFRVKFVDITKDIEDLVKKSGLFVVEKEKLIVLSPFSFHVPFVEKEVAGVQLILVLGLFLLSGFILGFWVANRNFLNGK